MISKFARTVHVRKDCVCLPTRPPISVSCPFCWTEQRADRDYCYHCGVPFVYRNETDKDDACLPARPPISVTCPFCWTEQRADRDRCYHCGVHLAYQHETDEKCPQQPA